MEEIIHPHEAMADFVNKYENSIRSSIKNKNISEINGLITSCLMNEEIVLNNPQFIIPKIRTGRKYLRALSNLKELMKKGYNELLVNEVERDISDLDLILQEDSHYKKFRRTQ